MEQTPEQTPTPDKRQLAITLDGVSIINTQTGEDQTPVEAVTDLHELEGRISLAEREAEALDADIEAAKQRVSELKAKKSVLVEEAKKATRLLRERVRAMKAMPLFAGGVQ